MNITSDMVGTTNAMDAARPVWVEIDLDIVTANVAKIRKRAGADKRFIVPVKANAYGHGVVEIAKHLQTLNVDGLATANVADALAMRQADVSLPILIFGAQLPGGNTLLVENRLTPTVYDEAGVAAVAQIGRQMKRKIAVHMKVDAGFARLGVRLENAVALAGQIAANPNLHLEGVYTHIPFSDPSMADWSKRRLNAFAGCVSEINKTIGYDIEFAQAAASSVMANDFPDPLNTVSPGHFVFGLSPISGLDVTELGFFPALRAIKACAIHTSERRFGDDISAPVLREGEIIKTAVILYGMDNGFTPARDGKMARVLIHQTFCPVIAVSAEYSVIDISNCPSVAVGDLVTVIGQDGPHCIRPGEVADALGAPSEAYWLVGLRNVPVKYSRSASF